MKILFVCLGNICRSPAAQAISQSLLNKHQRKDFLDSAGTGAWHQGHRSDARMIEHGERRGYVFDHLARQFKVEDFEKFDHILVMDKKNLRDVLKLDTHQKFHHKVELMMKYATRFSEAEVPDPYHDGEEGFELVLDMLEDACLNFFIEKKLIKASENT